MSKPLDQLMERASRALVEMHYLEAESLCLEGLRMARAQRDWVAYARVLMPLQECRRQRRMIAADTAVQLGTAGGIDRLDAGCIAVTHPHSAEDAARLALEAGRQRRHVEVLYCDNAVEADTWRAMTYDGSQIACEVPAPAGLPLNQRLCADAGPLPQAITGAGHWFIAATEALGEEALRRVTAPLGSLDRVEQLERMVQAVDDHEILHQRLGDAVRALLPSDPK
jgi:hypothetical protein